MALVSSLYTALSGLQAQQRVMDVTGHNVANQTTPGYHRQRVELQSVALHTGFNQVGQVSLRAGGVMAIATSRATNDVVAYRAVREDGLRSAADGMAATLGTIEGFFGEPSDNSIATELQSLWSTWSDVAQNPGNVSSRTALLEQTSTVINGLRAKASNLQETWNTDVSRMKSLAGEVNDLATQVAGLNKAISASPEAANDLLDQRDILIGKLSQLVGATPYTNGAGQMEVIVNGRALVSGQEAYAIQENTGTLQWVADARPVNAVSGEAASLTSAISDVIPRYQAALDGVAASLVQSVNALHSTGYDQAGTTGLNFFDPAGVTALTIALSTDVAGQPSRIAAGGAGATAPGALDGEMARQLAQLGAAVTGPDEKYRSMIGTLAVETRAAKQSASVQGTIADSAKAEMDSETTVSLDEEMTSLVAAQRAYEASARVLTAVDEMLGVLLERTGLVGR